MVHESTKAYHDNGLRLAASSSSFNAELINSEFGLAKLKKTYDSHLPCLTLLLSMLLTSQNDYERKNETEKIGKHDMAAKVHFPALPLILTTQNLARWLLSLSVFFSSLETVLRMLFK